MTRRLAPLVCQSWHLKPETAYSYYAGVVWSPGSSDPDHSWWGWANGFSAYMNWYEITQHNIIGNIGAQELINLESSFPAGDPKSSRSNY
jgi:hypothetical protein